GQFVERGFRRHLCNGINGDLTALRVSLTVPVHHLEGDLFYVQRLQCTGSVPCGNGWRLIFGTVRLREHEPIPLEHKTLERDFGLRLVSLFVLLFRRSLAGNGHTEGKSLLSPFHMSPEFFPTIE